MADLPLSAISHRLDQPGAPVWSVHYQAVERQARGEDVIVLSVGDPDFDTPPYISDHVIEQINKGRTHYSPAAGEVRLRSTIADMESNNIGRRVEPEQVVVFPGCTTALFSTLSCIANPGDGVVVAQPMYAGYFDTMAAVGVETQFVHLDPPAFDLSVEKLLAQIQPHTKAVLLNTPGNPCGNVIPAQQLEELAKECAKRDLWLICDEVYSLITFDEPHTSLLKCTEDLRNIVVIDGLSKSHAMTGWRVGWTVTSEEMAQTLTRFSGAYLFGTAQFIQDGAAYALANDAADVEKMRIEYQKRRDYVIARARQIPGLELARPKAGMFAMIDVSALAEDGASFSQALLDAEGVSVLPGSCFGPSGNNYVRLSLTETVEVLGTALDRIARFCANIDQQS